MTAYPRPYSLSLALTPDNGAATLASFHRAEGGHRHWHRLQPDPDATYLVACVLAGAEGRSSARFEFAPAPTGCTLTIAPAEAADWGARLGDSVRGAVGSFHLAPELDPTCVAFCARFEAHLRALGVVTGALAPACAPNAIARNRAPDVTARMVEDAYHALNLRLDRPPTQVEVALDIGCNRDTVRNALNRAGRRWAELRH